MSQNNTLYIEPFSGAAGDMILSALCGLTNEYEFIATLPELLNLPDGKIEINELDKNGIVCKHVKIVDLYENTHAHSHSHSHSHGHSHDGHHHHHHLSDYIKIGFSKIFNLFGSGSLLSPNKHIHRGLKEINEIIENGNIAEGAKQIAKDIFLIIGHSESKIHNIPLDVIHFHEVSGVDSILDIVGCAVLLDKLKIVKTYCDNICTGFGNVKTQHGILPVPAPATFDIIKDMPFYKGNEAGEKLTPTGAAIIKYLNPSFEVPSLVSIKSAYGPGQKDFKNANVIRISLVEKADSNSALGTSKADSMILVECNIDDSSGEILGNDFQEQLLKKGAVDFYYTHTQMKKGRPGIKLSILVNQSELDIVSDYVLECTTSIGLRYAPVERKILKRRIIEVETTYGPIKVKEVITPSGLKRHKIEFDSLKEIRKKHDINIQQLQTELYQSVIEATQ